MIKIKNKKSLLKPLTDAFPVLLTITVCLMLFLAIYGKLDNVTYQEDAVIVLGAGIRGERVTLTLARRLDKAVAYGNKNLNSVIVVSGGQGPREDITEALAMERYLVSKGMAKERIIKEEKSTSTYENLLFSKDILDKYFHGDYTTALITNDFHIYRATRFSKIVGLNSSHAHAKTPWYTLWRNYPRECAAIVKMFFTYTNSSPKTIKRAGSAACPSGLSAKFDGIEDGIGTTERLESPT